MLVEALLVSLKAQAAPSAEVTWLLAQLEHAPHQAEVILRDDYAALYEVLGIAPDGQIRTNEIWEVPDAAFVVRYG